MGRKLRLINLNHLFFMPSFYGGLAWFVSLILYMLRLIEWEENSNIAKVIFLTVQGAYISSVIVFAPFYRSWILSQTPQCSNKFILVENKNYSIKLLILVFHIIGFIGIIKYVLDFSNNLGGISGFFFALFHQSYMIRWQAEITTSFGTQLTYFGWLAITLTVFEFTRKKISTLWLLLAVLQYALNFMYIDRTRPIWIMFTTVLMILPIVSNLSLWKMFKRGILLIVIAILLFLGIAQWVGKVYEEGKYGYSILPGPAQDIYFYITSGFAYFNKMLEVDNVSYSLERTLYPLLKLLSYLKLIEAPSSQIIEFYSVPFPTNVGTFMEPFYRDGGLLYVGIGIIIYSFGLDAMGLKFLKSRKLFAIFAWSNICFMSFIGFFTPKIASFPMWLFCGLGILSLYTQQSYLIKLKKNKLH